MRRNSDRPGLCREKAEAAVLARTNANPPRIGRISARHMGRDFLCRLIQEDEGGSFVFCKKLLGQFCDDDLLRFLLAVY